MFISNQEKKQMRESITYLLAETSNLKNEILFLTSKLKAAEGNILVLKEEIRQTKKVKKALTAAQKTKQREYQKAYNARKKAEKLAKENTNVSS